MKQYRTILSSSALVLTVVLAGSASAQTSQIKPSSPAVVAPPSWSRVLHMPDGRTFVTDGGLSVDVKVAKPAALPTIVIPPESARHLAGRMAEPYDREIGFGELGPGGFNNSFSTPDGISLNGNYVNFLRPLVPVARTRLRTRGKTDAVVMVIDGQAVAIMMPLQPVR